MSEPLPIFPLSNVVLFPRLQTPLHLFEPRYRQMARDALAGDRRIGMVVVQPDRVEDMGGDPPIFEIGCAGTITQSQELPDGRFNIVLLGEYRFRVESEPDRPPERLYRVAEVERLEDPLDPAETPRIAALRSRAVELVGDLVRRSDAARSQQITPALFEGVDDATLVNALSNAFTALPQERQGLLEAPTILTRFQRLVEMLDFRLAELSAPGGSSDPIVH